MPQEAARLQFGTYPLYSVDASALIDFKDYYPRDFFPSMWQLVENLAAQNRLFICEQVKVECHDAELRSLVSAYPGMVVDWASMEEYFRRFQAEAQHNNILLTPPGSPTDEADPYVVALALMLEQRDLQDLRRRLTPDATCVVVTQEKPAGPGAKRPRIPNVCEFYGLRCIPWLQFLKNEGYAG